MWNNFYLLVGTTDDENIITDGKFDMSFLMANQKC